MKYRTLGRTGLQVSEIGMGCEGFEHKSYEETMELMDMMEANGVNCLDLYTSNPDLRRNVGRALKGRRDRFILQAHLCTIWEDNQYKRTRDPVQIKEGFLEQLQLLEIDHVEIGMIHYVDTLADWREVSTGKVMEYAQQLKEAGTIGCIGMSSHNPEVSLEAVNSGLIDVLMFSVNPCYDLLPATEVVESLWDSKNYEAPLVNMEPQRELLYETCQRLGVGITVMKAFGGGDLLSDTYSPAGKALTAYQCLHYALTRPGVASVMSGARNPEELRISIGYCDAPQEEKDYAIAFAALPKISWKGHCMYCGHCAPCPQGIDVASVTKFLNLAIAQGNVPETVREHYAVLSHTAEECIGCGDCEGRCPFEVPIIQNMERAVQVFGK